MTNNITQRDAFWNRVYEMAKVNRNIVIVSADMGAPSMDRIRRDLAAQFVNVGIAEQNAILIASGLALKGKRVFVYAIAPFITLRCLEEIRVQNGLMKIPLTIVGVGAGLGYEDSGPTHHLIEDIAIMRALPYITIHSVTDSTMAVAVAEMSCSMKTTNYVRLERKKLPDVYQPGADFSAGLSVLQESKDYYIISTGNMTHRALEIAAQLNRTKHQIGVIDVHTLPINGELLVSTVKGAKRIVTLEEHFLMGGMGSAVCEVLADRQLLIPVKRIGMSSAKGYCYEYGGREAIRKYYGIDKESVAKTVVDFFK